MQKVRGWAILNRAAADRMIYGMPLFLTGNLFFCLEMLFFAYVYNMYTLVSYIFLMKEYQDKPTWYEPLALIGPQQNPRLLNRGFLFSYNAQGIIEIGLFK